MLFVTIQPDISNFLIVSPLEVVVFIKWEILGPDCLESITIGTVLSAWVVINFENLLKAILFVNLVVRFLLKEIKD